MCVQLCVCMRTGTYAQMWPRADLELKARECAVVGWTTHARRTCCGGECGFGSTYSDQRGKPGVNNLLTYAVVNKIFKLRKMLK